MLRIKITTRTAVCFAGHVKNLIAKENNEVEEKAKEWEVDPSDVRCNGCKNNINSNCCVDCDLKQCAESKRGEFCFQCEGYPCKNLLDFRNDKYSHHSIVLKNLEFIRENDWNVG